MNTTLQNSTVAQLRKALEIKEQIQLLEDQLAAIGGGAAPSPEKPGRVKLNGNGTAAEHKTGKRRKMSAATKAKIAAVARARWAKARAAGKSVL